MACRQYFGWSTTFKSLNIVLGLVHMHIILWFLKGIVKEFIAFDSLTRVISLGVGFWINFDIILSNFSFICMWMGK
jgi:hypothetical protein